jgi:hypothetical protein
MSNTRLTSGGATRPKISSVTRKEEKWNRGPHRFRQGLEDLRCLDLIHILVICAGKKLHDQQTADGRIWVELQGELAIHAA